MRAARAPKAIIWLGIMAMFWLVISGAPGVEAQSTASVQGTGGDGVNLRAQPNRDARILTAEPDGAVLTITGPEQLSDGRKWRPVTDANGLNGWVVVDFLSQAKDSVTPTPIPAASGSGVSSGGADATATPRPTVTPTPVPPGPPLDLEIKFKYPEIDRRIDQTIYVWAMRGTTPIQDVAVSFTVEDEDPEVERISSNTNEEGRSSHDWSMRRFRGTTVVKVKAIAPDGGEGKAEKSFFVR
jgi:hypothetical protein